MRTICCRSFAALVVSATAPAALATTIDLDTTALPTTQAGWSWVTVGNHAGLAESSYFSVSGSDLVANSLGEAIGLTQGGAFAEYDLAGVTPDASGIITLEATLRVTQSVVQQFNYGFYLSVAISGVSMDLGFSISGVASSDLSFYALDPTDWHTYTLVGDLNSGTYSASIDGQQIFAAEPFAAAASPAIRFGDGTGTANARAEIAELSATVPAPGVIALALPLAACSRRGRPRAEAGGRQAERVHA